MLEPNRGQAMGMPFIITGIFAIIFFTIYIILIVCDRFLKKKWSKYLAIITQAGVIGYTIYMYLYYYDFRHNWDKEKHEAMDGLFPPGEENYWVIGLFSLSLFIYFIYTLRKDRKQDMLAEGTV